MIYCFLYTVLSGEGKKQLLVECGHVCMSDSIHQCNCLGTDLINTFLGHIFSGDGSIWLGTGSRHSIR